MTSDGISLLRKCGSGKTSKFVIVCNCRGFLATIYVCGCGLSYSPVLPTSWSLNRSTEIILTQVNTEGVVENTCLRHA